MESTLHKRFVELETRILSENGEIDDSKMIDQALHIMSQINAISLFSTNETLDEVTTSSLAMLKMPYYVGDLYYRKKYHIDTRKQDLEQSKMYIANFCNVCHDYKLVDKKWKQMIISLIRNKGYNDQINKSILTRKFTMELYNEQKKLSTSIKMVNKKIKKVDLNENEEYIRQLQLDIINLFIYQSIDLLNNINRELAILNTPTELRNPNETTMTTTTTTTANNDCNPTRTISPSIKLVKIDTINEVFGSGYPSLPTVTLDQWVDQQIADGSINLTRKNPSSTNPEDEQEISDDKIDDTQLLDKERNFDDFKDNNRRGKGNRINQG